MVPGGPHDPDVVRAISLYLVRTFDLRMPVSFRAEAAACDVDDVQGHSSSELLCVMAATVDGHMDRHVLEQLVHGCA